MPGAPEAASTCDPVKMANRRDFSLGVTFLALSLTGCATTKVEKLPDQPGMERVTWRGECERKDYPFHHTANQLHDLFLSNATDVSPSQSVSENYHAAGFFGELVGLMIVTPLYLATDGLLMPWELYKAVTPECQTLVVKRPIEGYPHLDEMGVNKTSRHSLLFLRGQGFSSRMLVRFGDVRVHPEDVTGDVSARVRVPDSLAFGELNVSIENSVGKSNSQSILMLPSKPPVLQVKNLTFVDNERDRDRILSAGKSGAILFTVVNSSGAGDEVGLVSRVRVVPGDHVSAPLEVTVGAVPGGSHADVSIPLAASLDTPTGKVTVTVTFKDTTGFPPDPVSVRFETRKLAVPELVVADMTMDDHFYPDRKDKLSVGNGDGIIQPGEQVEIAAKLVNRGEGTSSRPKVSASCATPGATLITQPELTADSILPGKWADVGFVLSLRKDFAASEVRIDLHVEDAKVARFNTDIPMVLAVGKSFPSVTFREVKGHPSASKKVEIPTFGEELLPPPHTTKANPDAVAVVIGVQHYKNADVPSVDYALNDAEVVEEYAVKAMGISPENVIMLRDASKGDLERVFGTPGNPRGQLYNLVAAGKSDVVVYYSGHGAPDPETRKAYLVPADGDPNYVKVNGYPLQLLFDNLNAVRARSATVVLDACFSGGSPKGSLIAKASPLMMTTDRPSIGKITLFASSAGNEISSWFPQKRHGLFTYFFLDALHGAGAKRKGRQITAAEVRDYLSQNVPPMARRLFGREQDPRFYGDEGRVLARY